MKTFYVPLCAFVNKQLKTIALLILLVSKFYSLNAQTIGDYRSSGSGNWTSSSSWQTYQGVWISAISYPGQYSTPANITIQSGHAISVDATPTNKVCSNTLTVAGTLNVNNNLPIANGGDVTVSGIITFAESAIMNGGSGGGSNSVTFTLNSSGTLKTANAGGITTSGNTGSIQVNSTRTYNAAADFEYNGTVAQVTGNGLPNLSSGGILVISNTTSTVTLSSAFTIGTGATATVNENATLITGSTITKTGTLNVNGIFQLNSGGSVSGAPIYSTTSTLVYNKGGAVTVGNEWTGNGTTAGTGIPQNVIIQNSTNLTLSTTNRGIAGNLSLNSGSLILNATSGNLYIGGDWTRAASTTFTQNGRIVYFNGTAGNQTITSSSGGSQTFTTLSIDKAAGSLLLNNSPATSITLSGTSGSVLEIKNAGQLDLNGQTITFSGTGGNIAATGGTRTITGTGSVVIAGSKTVTGTALILDANTTLKLSASLNFGTGNLTTIKGILQLDNGGTASTNAPKYANTSTLVYNKGGAVTVGTEWTGNSTTAGTGIPQNVTIQNNTALTMSSSNRGLAGNLNLTSGSLILNTTSGDLYIGGDWNRSTGTTFTQNGRMVYFNGTAGNQTITSSSGGSQTFTALSIDKAAGSLLLNNSPATSITLSGTSGPVLEIKNVGQLDLNGQTITLSGTGGNIAATGGTRTITGTGSIVIAGSKTVTGTALVLDTNTTLKLISAFNFGTGNLTTIKGILQIENGGSVTTSPVYSNTSLLIYNSGTTYTVGNEWTGNDTIAGIGIPQDVRVENGTTLDMPNSDRGVAGEINIEAGTLILNAASDMYVGGNWKRTSSTNVNYNNRKVIFNGGNDQTIEISGGGTESFNSIAINKNNGKVKLSSTNPTSLTIAGNNGNVIELKNNGELDLNGQTLTISGNGGNIYANGGTRRITSSGNGSINITGSKTFTGNTTVIDSNVTVNISGTVDFGIGNLAQIEGNLQLNNGAVIANNAPNYGANATLVYNQSGIINSGAEWDNNSSTNGAGNPKNITIQNGTILNTPASERQIPGKLTIIDGQMKLNTTVYLNKNSDDVIDLQATNSIDLNDNTLVFSNDGGNINANGGTRNINGNGTVMFSGRKTITGSSLVFGDSVTVKAAAAVNFGTGSIGTINGKLQLVSGGTVETNAPRYGNNSTVEYYQGGNVNLGLEWNGNSTSVGIAIPKNVVVRNNTIINFPATDRGIPGNLLIDSGTVSLNTTSGNLYIGGNWRRSATGSFNHNKRSVTFNNTGNSTITTPTAATRNRTGSYGGEIFYKVYMNKTNKSDSVKLSSNVAVESELGFVKGTFDLGKSDVTLASTDLLTANVAPISSLNDVLINYSDTGKFIVQRHLPINPYSSSRRWRLLAAPISSSSTNDISINRAWQEGAKNTTLTSVDPQPGYGTTITNGNTAAAVNNGFDLGTTTSPSIYYLTPGEAPAWVAPTTTYAPIAAKEGYMLFIRGHRSISISNQYAAPDSTTLEPKGRLITGDVTKNIVKGLQVIGNPYASAINFNNISFNGINAASDEGIGLTFYLWDPKSPGASNVGQWITFSSNGDGTYTVSPTPVSKFGNTGIIESGAAFLINSDVPGTLVIHESDKVSSSSTVGIASRPTGTSNTAKVSINMYLKNADGSRSLMDGTTTMYGEGYRNIVDVQDAVKVTTFTSKERISTIRDSKMLSIERRNAYDTIYLSINKLSADVHVLEIGSNNIDITKQAYLEDKYLNTITELTPNTTVFYEFSTSGNAAASDTSRFRIVFRKSTTLPVRISSVKATKNVSANSVDWTVENETNVKAYVVEKSINGIQFTTFETIPAKNNSGESFGYNIKDNSTTTGPCYYRIKIITLSGESYYSEIVMIKSASNVSSVSIFPNPVKNKMMNITFENQAKGNHIITLKSITGQTILHTAVNVSSSYQTESISLPSNTAKGTYFVNIALNGMITTKKIEIQ